MSPESPSRSFGQLAVAATFGLLGTAFLLRSFFYGYKWLTHVVEGTANFKVMTIWTLVYFAVCSAIAWVAWSKPAENNVAADAGSDRA